MAATLQKKQIASKNIKKPVVSQTTKPSDQPAEEPV
jgi:hypothetical protein